VIEAKDKWGFDYSTTVIKTYRLETMLDKYLDPGVGIDLVNIDVEDLKFQILLSSNWDKYRPEVIVVELHERYIEDVMQSDIYKFLFQKGYRMVSKTYITLIFRRAS